MSFRIDNKADIPRDPSFPHQSTRTEYATNFAGTSYTHYQTADQDATTNLDTGITTYTPYPGADRHRDPLCDLPYLSGLQDLPSQRLLYLFLLIAGPGHRGSTVPIVNHLFHRTSDIITFDGKLVMPAPALPPQATEADLKRMLVEQNLYPTDSEGISKWIDETRQQRVAFIGQGRQRGMIYRLDEVLDMLQAWIEEAGIQLVRDRGSEQSGES